MDEGTLEAASALVARHDGTRMLGPQQRLTMATAIVEALEAGQGADAAAQAMLSHDTTFMVPMGQAQVTVSAIARLVAAQPASPAGPRR